MTTQTPPSPTIGHKRQREEPEAQAPKTKTCQCGSRVSDAEVRASSWTLGSGLSVILCSNCPHQK